MRLRFTPEAAAELENVLSDIALHSPQGRHRVQGRIKAIIGLLLEHPRSGRFTNLRPVRRIATTPYPYVIFYEATEDEIIILAVRHGARDPSSLPAF